MANKSPLIFNTGSQIIANNDSFSGLAYPQIAQNLYKVSDFGTNTKVYPKQSSFGTKLALAERQSLISFLLCRLKNLPGNLQVN